MFAVPHLDILYILFFSLDGFSGTAAARAVYLILLNSEARTKLQW